MLVVVAGGFVVVGAQFEGILAKNVAMANDVLAARAEISSLRERERTQQRTLRRLASPDGAIPEIHARLRLVGPREEIIYVREPAAPGDAGAIQEK
jgi:hypothetical protein